MKIISYLAAALVLVAALAAKEEDACKSVVRVSPNVMLTHVTKFVAPGPEPHLVLPRGIVLLRAMVDIQGKTSQIRVVGDHPILTPRAVEALRQWEYTPFLRRGKALPVCFDIRIPVKRDYATPFADVKEANAGEVDKAAESQE